MRIPVQDRSRARVERIVATAAAMLASSDEPLTVRALAARAVVAAGTIYQFFADMDAVATAVREEAATRLADLLREEVPCETARDPVAFFATLLRAIDGMQSRHPALGCIARPTSDSVFVRALAGDLRDVVTRYVLEVFSHVDEPPGRLSLPSRLNLASVVLTAALADAPNRDAPDRDAYVDAVARAAGSIFL